MRTPAKVVRDAGLRVTVLEKKTDPGAKLHTTGIIVKDAVDQIALLDTLPTSLVRRIPACGYMRPTYTMSISKRQAITSLRPTQRP